MQLAHPGARQAQRVSPVAAAATLAALVWWLRRQPVRVS
jgi:hypothetical protein